jgi:phenylalanyl-tRNA synthetase beta chain
MAAIKVLLSDLKALSNLKEQEILELLVNLGIPIESINGDELELEITPNRPDFLSVEGIARALKNFKFAKIPQYSASLSNINIVVDSSVKNVRPFIGGALIKNVKLTPSFLESLIQLQEKLHLTLGRKRKKMAIGLHDISKAKPPFFYYAAKPQELSFIPLDFDKPLTPKEILLNHPKGREYSHLIKDLCPILKDSENNVLSFPPIINGEFSKLTLNSNTIFIDCTGFDLKTINQTVNILAAVFADRGATIQKIKVNNKVFDIFKPIKTKFDYKKANKLLGLDLSLEKQKLLLKKMGHDLQKNVVISPPFRVDILDSVDLIEDIAIAFGYNNFKPIEPNFFSTGSINDNFDWLAELLLGAGFFEVSSWILTNKNVLKKSNLNEFLEVSNPLTEEFSVLRPYLYPNLLEIFSISKSSKMPQKIFEIGPVVSYKNGSSLEKTHCCFAILQPKANFSLLVCTLKGIFKSLKLEFELVPEKLDGFIIGRTASILLKNKKIGFIGEVHPEILERFSIEQPVVMAELFLNELK